ncbi:MAG: cytochrome C [Acidobacteria bacterium]|nr:cytochrome C [Acidobacteriota bacterium]
MRRLTLFAIMLLAAAVVCGTLSGNFSVSAQTGNDPEKSSSVGPYHIPEFIPPNYIQELDAVLAQLDQIEQQTLAQARALPINPGTRLLQVRTLGKLILYDKSYSVRNNTPCTLCHVKETGFTGPLSDLNQDTVSYPGSVRYRFTSRKPKSYAYSPYSQVFHLDPGSKLFYGGNFWDQRATAWKLQNPSSQQAEEPPLDPLEMGFPDSACAVYRLSKAPYLFLFKDVWGIAIEAVKWPPNTGQICSTPTMGPPDPDFPGNVPLDKLSRAIEKSIYDQFAMSIVADEAGPDVSPFNSKFDYAITHPKQQVLSAAEMAGWRLFDGKGKCNLCHTDSLSAFQQGEPDVNVSQVPDTEPLFTDFAAFNLGLPKNDDNPYLYEDKPDNYGVNPNPQGPSYIDLGLGAFLSDMPGVGQLNPNNRWKRFEPASNGKFQTATIRDVDKRPYPGFVKAYFHNGFVKSLKDVVHFYNTRDVLAKCSSPDSPGVGKTCWPSPEVPENVDQRIGNLGLTDEEENEIVDFMKTLSDGYFPINPSQ